MAADLSEGWEDTAAEFLSVRSSDGMSTSGCWSGRAWSFWAANTDEGSNYYYEAVKPHSG